MMRTTKTLKGVFLRAWGSGKATLLAMVVALTLATVTPAIAANGGNFLLGRSNTASAVTSLTKSGVGAALQLVVPAGQPPMVVNAAAGKATNLNADKLDGKDSSQLKATCLAGTQSLGGACIETTQRGEKRLNGSSDAASETCAGLAKGRLPTAAELDAFRQKPGVTIGTPPRESGGGGEWTGDLSRSDVSGGTGALTIRDDGTLENSDRGTNHAFRCVVSPS